MKRISFFAFAWSLILLLGCGREQIVLSAYKPVLIQRESLERSINWMPASPIKSPAKIYYKDNYILISERYKGVHVVNNQDPSKPVQTGYISVPGCVDMAMKDNTLYVDNAVDLVAIDISGIASGQIIIKKRIKEALPELIPPDGLTLPERYNSLNRPKNTLIINWVKENN